MNQPTALSPAAWLQAHAATARDALTRLRAQALASGTTILMMGFTLALPAALWVLSQNAALASDQWQRQFSLSVYLQAEVSEKAAEQLRAELVAEPEFARADYLSPAAALREFEQFSGFGDALGLLQDNPLPAVIVLWPSTDLAPQRLKHWLEVLAARPEVELAQADSEWLERLQQLLDFGARLIQIMGGLLALTVLLVIGNTIRLDIENRREEIVVMKLIGAPDGFIQRPFLYTGTLYGLLSGLVACLAVALILALLAPQLQSLAALYQQELALSGLALADGLRLIVAASVLGWFGAWQCVRRHLGQIEPE